MFAPPPPGRRPTLALLLAYALLCAPTPTLLGAAGCALAVLAPSAALAQEDEARRQLRFARDELTGHHFGRALESADSALRLMPSLYGAMLVQSLAYEGLGNLGRAESILIAFLDLAGNTSAGAEGRAALVRIREAKAQTASPKKASKNGIIVVELRYDGPGGPPEAILRHGEDLLHPSEQDKKHAVFRDVPAGALWTLLVGGEGIRTERLTVAGLRAGETRRLTVDAAFVGRGRVRVGHYQASRSTAWLRSGLARLKAAPDSTHEVNAGPMEAVVSGKYGEVTVPIEVVRDHVVDFDAASREPAALFVDGLPAGARLTVTIVGASGAQLDHAQDLPSQVGEIDAATGLRLADRTEIRSLIGGEATLRVQHRSLGDVSAELSLAAGDSTLYNFDFWTLPRISEVQTRFTAWQATHKGAGGARVLPGLALAIGGGIAGGLLAVLAVNSSKESAVLGANYDLLQAAGGGASADEALQSWNARQQATTRLGIGAAIGAGVLSGGVVLTVALGASGSAKTRYKSWNPYP